MYRLFKNKRIYFQVKFYLHRYFSLLGNVPSNRQDLVDELRQAAEKGVLIVNTTQCSHGAVAAIYETGAALFEAGVISGADMTPEAALTKLSYVLSKKEWDLETKRQMMMTNLRGELTLPQSILFKDSELVEAVARSLRMSSGEEMDRLKDVLFPTLLCTAVQVCSFLENFSSSLFTISIHFRHLIYKN